MAPKVRRTRFAAASVALVLVGGMLVAPPVAAQSGDEPALPPQASTDCTGDVAVAVASDARAQSDIYAAALLAASLATDCVVLAGERDEPMPADQVARLNAALAGGYIVGGIAAVPASKPVHREGVVHVGGADRWATIARVGQIVAEQLTGEELPLVAVMPDMPPQQRPRGVALPPQASTDCTGDVAVAVASDARAQSDIYAAALLAASLGTDCIVLAGARDEPMPADQVARLNAARAGGYIVGGITAVPESKPVHREGAVLVGGADRWATIARVGQAVGGQTTGTDRTDTNGGAAAAGFTALTAGDSHWCGLRADGTVACWGDNQFGQTVAPSGAFSSLSAAGSHTCGLRQNGELECWGDPGRYLDAALNFKSLPGGAFSSISTAISYGCGLRRNGALECWSLDSRFSFGQLRFRFGHDDQGAPPEGPFTDVAADEQTLCGLRTDGAVECWARDVRGVPSPRSIRPAGAYSAITVNGTQCGLRTDGTVACWRGAWDGPDPSPSGTFSAVSAGTAHACGLRTGGAVECWGPNRHGEASPPGGTFAVVTAGNLQSCGVRTTGAVECWGGQTQASASPGGPFTSVSGSGTYGCGLRRGGTIDCWGQDKRTFGGAGYQDGVRFEWEYSAEGLVSPPSGVFTAVSVGAAHACGLRISGTVACWGNNKTAVPRTASDGRPLPGMDVVETGQASPPSGVFVAVSAGVEHSCGIRADRRVACWGRDRSGSASPPAGAFSAVSAGGRSTCGVRVDGAVECWGDANSFGTALPTGAFTAVSKTDGEHGCGLRRDGAIECFGTHNPPPPASGPFTVVLAGGTGGGVCGLRTDGAVECWGNHPAVAPLTVPGSTFTAISSEIGPAFNPCGIRSDGSIECWGSGGRSVVIR